MSVSFSFSDSLVGRCYVVFCSGAGGLVIKSYRFLQRKAQLKHGGCNHQQLPTVGGTGVGGIEDDSTVDMLVEELSMRDLLTSCHAKINDEQDMRLAEVGEWTTILESRFRITTARRFAEKVSPRFWKALQEAGMCFYLEEQLKDFCESFGTKAEGASVSTAKGGKRKAGGESDPAKRTKTDSAQPEPVLRTTRAVLRKGQRIICHRETE